MGVKIKRVYEKPEKGDGVRVLIDRLWPRGVSKEEAGIDYWLKGIAPSAELRKWFGHDPEKWPEFRKRYGRELKDRKAAAEELRGIVRENRAVTLVFAARDEKHNNAAALKEILRL